MYYAIDEARRCVFFRVESAHLAEGQWAFYTERFATLSAEGGGAPFAIVVEAEAGSEVPNATWRQRFATAGITARKDAIFILIAKSPLARGVVIAVNWV